jgi:GNAT superfamily N-acetyltransferase
MDIMSIRRAKVSDWKSIRRLLDQLEYPGSEHFLEARLKRMVEDPEEVLLVWEEEDAAGDTEEVERDVSGEEAAGDNVRSEVDEDARPIRGLLSLHFIPQIAVEGDFARISYFVVDGNARSKGIGRAMEEWAARLARERGCHLIEVHCHERRARAHAFYARQGYEESPKYLIKNLIG